jgi:hypothetical protein
MTTSSLEKLKPNRKETHYKRQISKQLVIDSIDVDFMLFGATSAVSRTTRSLSTLVNSKPPFPTRNSTVSLKVAAISPKALKMHREGEVKE